VDHILEDSAFHSHRRKNLNRKKKELRGISPQANYTDRATAACRRSQDQRLRIEDVAWSAQRISTAVNLDFLDPELLLFQSSSSSVILNVDERPRSRPTYFSENLVVPVARNSDYQTTEAVKKNLNLTLQNPFPYKIRVELQALSSFCPCGRSTQGFLWFP
jgi:hypothetical protein